MSFRAVDDSCWLVEFGDRSQYAPRMHLTDVRSTNTDTSLGGPGERLVNSGAPLGGRCHPAMGGRRRFLTSSPCRWGVVLWPAAGQF